MYLCSDSAKEDFPLLDAPFNRITFMDIFFSSDNTEICLIYPRGEFKFWRVKESKE